MSRLDLSNVISVVIQTTQAGLGLPNINTALLISTEAKPGSWGGDAFKVYTNSSDVGTDFGSSSKAYKIAVAFFAQQPNPLNTNGYLAIGIKDDGGAEEYEDAVDRLSPLVYFFGVLLDVIIADDKLTALSNAVQSLDKLLFYASDDPADYAPGGILDSLRSAGNTHTRCLYYDGDAEIDTQRMAAAYAGRGLSTAFDGNNTTQTMHLKTLATIEPDATVDQTELGKAQDAGVDVYVSVAGVSCLFTSGENAFYDEVYNEFALKFAMQTAGFNYLKQTNTKIPQTEVGMEGLKNQYRKVCAQYVRNGFAAPGSWTSDTVFGDPESLRRNITDQGYYVYSQPVADQAQADREDRKAPLVQIAIKAAGAIHRSNVIVNVNL